jgi:hypothetical protein
MTKEFKFYSDLWLTANEWYNNRVEWLSGDWEKLNADEAEKFISERYRLLNAGVRYFRD